MSPNFLCRWQVHESVYCARRILAHIRWTLVQSCCTLSISVSYHVFIYGKYLKSRRVCVWLSDPDLSRDHPLL